jgi:hypothetical protein
MIWNSDFETSEGKATEEIGAVRPEAQFIRQNEKLRRKENTACEKSISYMKLLLAMLGFQKKFLTI